MVDVKFRQNVLDKQREQLEPQAIYLPNNTSTKKNTLLRVDGVRLEHGQQKTMTFSIALQQRCYLSGDNGTGKSTLLKAIDGQYMAYSGHIQHNCRTIYLDQHMQLLNPAQTMLDSLMTFVSGLSHRDARTCLQGLGFVRSLYTEVLPT
jgi:ATPase subunit of ABC transporter with duplicated ATPase domains